MTQEDKELLLKDLDTLGVKEEKSKNAVEWLSLHMPFGEVSKELRDEVIEDFKKYIEG